MVAFAWLTIQWALCGWQYMKICVGDNTGGPVWLTIQGAVCMVDNTRGPVYGRLTIQGALYGWQYKEYGWYSTLNSKSMDYGIYKRPHDVEY